MQSATPQEILVIEDERLHVKLIQQSFEELKEEFSLVWVNTLNAAREYLSEHNPSIILADLYLPDGNTADLLHQHELLEHLPVVIMTGRGNEEDAADVIKSGAMDYISKSPSSLLSMPKVCRKVLSDWEAMQDARRTKQKLEIAARQWSMTFDAISDMLVIISSENKIVQANKAYKKYFHGSRMEDAPYYESLYDTKGVPEGCIVRESLSKGIETKTEIQCKRKNSWLLLKAFPVTDDEGHTCSVTLTIQDVSERKSMELSLRESEARYHQLFNLESDALLLVDDETYRILDCNQAAITVYRYSREELLSMSWIDLTNEPAATRKSLEQKEDFIPVREHCRKDRTIFPAEITCGYFKMKKKNVHLAAVRDVTDRVIAELELEKQRAFLDHVVNTSPNLIYVKSPGGKYILTNQTFCDFFGLKANELSGKTVQDLPINEEQQKQALDEDRQIFEEGKKRIEHEESYCINGVQRWLYSIKKPMYGPEKGIEFLVGIAVEITDRKFVENSLLESRELFSAFMDELPAAAFIKDEKSHVQYANKFMQMFKESEHIIDKDPKAYLTPNQLEAELHEDKEAVKCGMFEKHEYTVDQNGTRRFWKTSKFPIRRTDRPPLIGGISLDLTKIKTAEEALERLAAAVDQAAEAFLITDAQGAIQYVNPAFEGITGYTREEVLGKTPSIIKSGKHDPDFYARMWSTLNEGNPWSGHIINKRKNGDFYEAEITISPIIGENGKIQNFSAVQRDVSKEATLENQLRQAQKMEAIGQLAGGIAHDFNNMLAAIIGYTDMILDETQEEDPIYQDILQIKSAGERSAALTRQLLAFSRKQVLEKRVLSPIDTINDIEKMLRRLIGENIELITNLNLAPNTFIFADPVQVEQVLMNLAVNARDAMGEQGCLTIEVKNVELDVEYTDTHATVNPGQYVLIAVSDTGCGMPAPVLAHIFEPFYTTKEKGKGTGLGLSTVYGIIQQHNGHIEVYSEEGHGTSFKIYMPLASGIEVSATEEEETSDVEGKGESILVVEDEEIVRELACKILASQGYKIIQAQRPSEALMLAKHHGKPFDLLLTDVIMPNMNGCELYQRLLAMQPDLKVMYMSGYTDNIVIHEGFLDPGMEFLHKPFTVKQLRSKVRDTLDHPRPRISDLLE